jgi:hypothetical protein
MSIVSKGSRIGADLGLARLAKTVDEQVAELSELLENGIYIGNWVETGARR